MTQILVIAQGMPEGWKLFRQKLDRWPTPHGVARIRPIVPFMIQCPQEDKKYILNELNHWQQSFKPQKMKDTPSYSFNKKERPFRKGRLQSLIYWLVKFFGGFIGMKPLGPVKQKKTNINARLVEFIVIGEVPDNFINNKVYGNEKEEFI